jgi:hypothetical protein
MRWTTWLLLACLLAPAAFGQDYLRTTDDETILGQFIKLQDGRVHFRSAALGTLRIEVERVADLQLEAARDVRIRTGDDVHAQQRARITARNGQVLIEQNGALRDMRLEDLRGIDEDVPDVHTPVHRPRWDVSLRGFFTWTDGNRTNINLGYRFDIRRKTPVNEMRLFGQGQYIQDRQLDRDSVRQRNFAVGFRYSYISSAKISADLTNDTSWDTIRGHRVRSVTGLGSSYFLLNRPTSTLRVSVAGTWTYEDNVRGVDNRDYFGTRTGFEGEHFLDDRSLRLRYKAEFLTDFKDRDNYRSNSELLIEYKFLQYFTFGVSGRHVWLNDPPGTNVRNDIEGTATLGFTWGGPGP